MFRIEHIHILRLCPDQAEQLNRIEVMIRDLVHQGKHSMATTQEILDKVTAQTGTVNSVVTLLGTIHQELLDAIAAGSDPATLQSIADKIDANTTALADAVVANPDPTPPAPTP